VDRKVRAVVAFKSPSVFFPAHSAPPSRPVGSPAVGPLPFKRAPSYEATRPCARRLGTFSYPAPRAG
jgi:hypothetical protein